MSNAIIPSKEDDDSVESPISTHGDMHWNRTNALTPVQLQDRGTMHRTDVSRREVDRLRDLRSRLLSAIDGPFITLVAPVSRGSGGSFVARNLAVSVAFDPTKSALLVDCDLHNPTQHVTMRLAPSGGGLIDYLEDPDADAENVLYDTGINGLRLIPTGNVRDMDTEYLSSFRMRMLMNSLRSRFPHCHIFMDSPPVLGSPDARTLANLADVVVLVAGYGRDTPAKIAEAAANFDPEKFAGVVFNEGV
ncbi:MAG TPA: polysaccharide biosynthesis protein [Pseudoxanthomonas sp.]